jgi:hypothetical protein
MNTHILLMRRAKNTYVPQRNIWQLPLKPNFWELIWNESIIDWDYHNYLIRHPTVRTKFAQLPGRKC